MKEKIRSTWIGKIIPLVAALVVLLLVGSTPAFAQAEGGDDRIWWTVNSGGQMGQTGGGYALNDTLGQPDAGTLNGSGYSLTGGFWQGRADEFVFHQLVLEIAGNGSGTVEQSPDDVYLALGTLITLTATADTGSSFAGWSGDVVGTANPITLIMDADKAVTATFSTDRTSRIYLPLVVRHAP